MEISPGLHRLSGGVCNWYLFEDGGKVTLVDAGVPGDWRLLITTLSSRGRVLADVDTILLTHAHSDHTGFAERARTEAGSRVWVHGVDAPVAKGGPFAKHETGMTRYLLRAEAYRTLFGLMGGRGLRILPIAEVSTFSDGEVIDVPGKPRVLHVPGHTPGSAALWFEARSVLCTGDALVTRNPMTGRRGPQIMPSGLNVDSTLALRSLDQLGATGAGAVLPGHGEPWMQGSAAAVEAARAAVRS